MATFVTIFTHASYEPPSCRLPRADWPPPERGSIAYEWALCCTEEKEQVLALTSYIFFVGCAVGAAVGGRVSDLFGRRVVVVYGTLVCGLSIIAAAGAPGVWTYAACRFVTGFAAIPVMMANFVLALEWVPQGWNAALSAFLFSATALGEMFLVPIAFLLDCLGLRGWRSLTLCVGCIILVVVAILSKVVEESPRWLHASGSSLAVEALCKACRRNSKMPSVERSRSFIEHAESLRNIGLAKEDEADSATKETLTTPDVIGSASGEGTSATSTESGSGSSSGSRRPYRPDGSLVAKSERKELTSRRSSRMSIRSICGKDGARQQSPLMRALLTPSTHAMALLWFTAAMTYYGISMSAKVLSHGVSLYAYAAMSAFSEIPSAFLAAWMLEQPWLGRRLSTTVLYLLGGIACVIMPWTPEVVMPMLAVMGKFFVTAAFDAIYVYASEVFTTEIRGSAMGFCSVAGRVGSVLAMEVAYSSVGPIWTMRLFGLLAIVSAVACRTVLPETRGAVTDADHSPLAKDDGSLLTMGEPPAGTQANAGGDVAASSPSRTNGQP